MLLEKIGLSWGGVDYPFPSSTVVVAFVGCMCICIIGATMKSNINKRRECILRISFVRLRLALMVKLAMVVVCQVLVLEHQMWMPGVGDGKGREGLCIAFGWRPMENGCIGWVRERAS